MSDFDQFASAEQPEAVPEQGQQEEDPAAAFLAREQDQLAELEGDNAGTEAAPAEEDAVPDADPFSQQQDALGGAEDSSAAVGAIDDVLDAFDPAFQSENAPTDGDAGFGFDQTPQEPEDPYEAVKGIDTERAEPEKIRIWRENQKVQLEEKDIESEKKKGEWRETAKKELEDWYKHLDEQLEKTKNTNRSMPQQSEEAFVQERDESQPGHEWERICRLCDFNPKAARNTKDVSRMRSILLQLKQTPLVR